VPLPVIDGVGESEPVLVGDGVMEGVGATAIGSATKTRFDTESVHAELPDALVADAMTSDGAVKAATRGAEIGPSVVGAMTKAPDDAVVPAHVTVAVSSDVGAEYASVTFTVPDVTADKALYENRLDPGPGAVANPVPIIVVDGCAWYRPPWRPAKSDCASNTYRPYEDTPKPPAPKLGAAVESATYTAKPSAPPPMGLVSVNVPNRLKDAPASTGTKPTAV